MIQALPGVPGTVKLIPAVRACPVTAPVPEDLIPRVREILSEFSLGDVTVEVGQHPNDHLFLSIEGPELHPNTLRDIRQRINKELKIGIVYSSP